MKRFIVVAFLVWATGCSSTPSVPTAPPPSKVPVQVLTDYPATNYENLGITDVNVFNPAIRDPSVARSIRQLKDKARAVGGNAFIVRDERKDPENSKSLTVSIEVLRLSSQ